MKIKFSLLIKQITFLLIVLFFQIFALSLVSDDKKQNEEKIEKIEKSILYNKNNDSLNKSDLLRDSTILPGSYDLKFSPFQDSAYFSALKLNIPASTRFYHDMKLFSGDWKRMVQEKGPSLKELANKNIQDLPDDYFKPSPTQVAMHQYNIYQSQYVPYVQTMKPFGMKVSLDAIGRFLGLTEDLSPTITYSLYETAHVEIVIYSVQANVIATIFSGRQVPGNYSYTWNGRNDRGRKMESGDYVGEVRIGKKRFIRKRIYLP